MRRLELSVSGAAAGAPLERALLALSPGLSLREARAMIEGGRVFVEGKRCRDGARPVAGGARLVVHEGEARGGAREPLRILAEDDDVVVVDKRPGEIVAETETSAELSLVEQLADRDAFTVHRIDRDTSGVVVLAKGRVMAERLCRAFEAREVEKLYLAIAAGEVTDGLVEAPIGPDRRRPRARRVTAEGKPAATRLCTLSRRDGLSAIEARPLTGRTHQIRVHLAFAGAPIAGDTLYRGPSHVRIGGVVVEPGRVLLHARAIRLSIAGRERGFEAPVPEDMARFEALGLSLRRGDGAPEPEVK